MKRIPQLNIFDEKQLRYIPVDNRIYAVVVSTIVLLLVAISISFYFVGRNSVEPEYRIVEIEKIDSSIIFAEEKLYYSLIDMNVKFPEVVVAQARFETGNYTSKIFKNNNNLFGMKCATQRVSTHSGEKNRHAYYNSWIDSMLDYALWQSRYASKIRTEEEYLSYLDSCYSEISKTYSSRLRPIIDSVKQTYSKQKGGM